MRKEMWIFGVLLIFILLLATAILIVLNPNLQNEGSVKQEDKPSNLDQPNEQEKIQINTSTPCPSELKIYYSIERNNTRPLEDDTIFINIDNLDANSYSARLFVDGELEDELNLKGMATAVSDSKIITEWWRSGNQSETRNFQLDLMIEGCDKSIFELAPALGNLTGTGGSETGSGGVSGGGGGGSSGTLPVLRKLTNVPD